MRFPMTLGRAAKVVTSFVALLLLYLFAVPFILHGAARLPLLVGAVVPVLVLLTLGLTFLWAPRAVRLDADALVIERLAWFELRVPYSEIAHVSPGPSLGLLGNGVLRVAGNGGLMGFTGFFWVRDVGVVRLWATQLGTPTLLLRRHRGRPLVLGVDDNDGLSKALKAHLGPWA